MYFELFRQKFPQDIGQVVLPLGQAYEQMGETDVAAEVYEEFLNTTRKNEHNAAFCP
jgi:hypothetical protein